MKVGLVTKEWSPHIYGGAGVHVKYLAQSLRSLVDVDVHCFGEARLDATAYELTDAEQQLNPAMQALITDAQIASNLGGVDIVHSHTWYANMAGHFAKILHKIPHVITAHSLEPDRPWKEEQIGGGYRISLWAEKTAYESADAIIAVSQGMRRDVLKAYPSLDPNKVHAILNGIDTKIYYPQSRPDLLESLGIKSPYAIFVGRITRQKGLVHLLRAWKKVDHEYGLVLCAGSPDEPGIGAEVQSAIEELQAERNNVVWISKMAQQEEIIALLSGADLFVCPSIYEPLGIVNLEAMACETAVLASDVGGIPEVVDDGVTGELVHYSGNADEFETSFTEKVNSLMADQDLLRKYGEAGRIRAIDQFSWDTIAKETVDLYKSLIK
ncbi:MAG: glycogen synthase [Actinomycetota bacterium]